LLPFPLPATTPQHHTTAPHHSTMRGKQAGRQAGKANEMHAMESVLWQRRVGWCRQ
jgi:hypothetical protein